MGLGGYVLAKVSRSSDVEIATRHIEYIPAAASLLFGIFQVRV